MVNELLVAGVRISTSYSLILILYLAALRTIVSKITASLPPGTVVTTPRTDVHYVVTEYGVADLRERSIAERVKAFVNIAHPDFRDELARQAREYGIIFA